MKKILLIFIFLSTSGYSYSDRLSLEELQKILRESNATWTAGETNISKLPEEVKRRLFSSSIIRTPQDGPDVFKGGLGAVPSKFDWRNNNGKNFVTPVKFQDDCGACWAFASIAALESKYLIQTGKAYNNLLDLSEQILISCNNFGGGCNGGYLDNAAKFLKNTGTYDESCYPYKKADTSCAYACNLYGTYVYKISSYQYVSQSVTALKEAVYNYGPIPVAMMVYQDFEYYQSGVYSHRSGSQEGAHAVLIVGWDDSQSCFIVKNSFSTAWGESGYFRIAYSEVSGDTDFGYSAVAYGNVTATDYVQTMLSTDPGGKSIRFDGYSITTPVVYSLPAGSSHTVSVNNIFTESDGKTRYIFDNRSDGKGINDNVVIPSNDSSILWSYKLQYLFKTSVNNTTFGRVDPDCSSGCWIDYWTGATFSAIPNSGYQFKNWSGDISSTTNPLKFTVTEPLSITANFEKATVKTYTINASAGANGKILPSGAISVPEKGSQAFDILPDNGYSVEDVLVDNISVGAVTKYVFSNVTANHTIYAKFISNSIPTYTIVASASNGGKIQPEGSIVVRKGASQTFTMTPDSGYVLDDVIVDGISVGSVSSYTFKNVVANHGISAVFKPASQNKEYVKLSIKYSGNGSGAVTSDPAGLSCKSDCSGWFIKGSTVKLYANPSTNSNFGGWNFSSCGQNRECGIVLNSDATITVYFILKNSDSGDRTTDENASDGLSKSDSGCSCSIIE
ncbi:MAG: C1 family peptidase [Myxococcota bacterium]